MILSKFSFSKHQNEKNSVLILLDSRTRRTLKSSVVVLGLVKLIDAKGIDVAQLIWPWGCPTYAQKWPKNTKNAFFASFWAYVGQTQGQISWATSMPFASINFTNPRTNSWNFWSFVLLYSHENKSKFIG